MPLSGEVVAETTATGRLNITVTFCQAAGFTPSTPSMVQLTADKLASQGGANFVKMNVYQYASDTEKKCFRFGFQMAPEQVLQYKGRRMFVQLYANGALLPGSPIERGFTMPSVTPTAVARLPILAADSAWPSWGTASSTATSASVAEEAARAIAAQASIDAQRKANEAALAQATATRIAAEKLAIQAAADKAATAARIAETVKAATPTKQAMDPTIKDLSPVPLTSLKKDAVELPSKGAFGPLAYAGMGVAILAGFWWHRQSR